MNIYLIRGEIEERPYMNDHKTYEDLRIVMAETADDVNWSVA